MKKIFLTTAIITTLLGLSACGSQALSNNAENNFVAQVTNADNDLDEVETVWIMADYPHYDSITHLASYATDVVRVEVLDERVEWLNTWLAPPPSEIDPYNLYTIYRIRVLEVFQGDATVGDILEVRQMGGETDSLRVINTDEVSLAVGDDLVLFLRASYIENFPAVLLNPYQGAYHFASISASEGIASIEAEELANIDVHESLESVNPENDLVLTIEDLIQILEDDDVNQNE
ncbi:MAG: hypothetical protein FWE07_00130 [Turicibacter sp.]|nr:hypothetical protein [Turicibacter sp.]